MILVFDTETTGKADFKSPPEATHQPRIVQIGAMVFDYEWRVRAEINLIIKPPCPIPREASNIHGITDEVAQCFGIDEIAALHVFDQLLMRCEHAVAHNFDFDHFMLSRGSKIRREYLGSHGFCTMRATTPICRIPNQYGYSDFKWPKLEEAYKHAFGENFEGAHDAMADVRACARIYRWLKDTKPEPREVAAL